MKRSMPDNLSRASAVALAAAASLFLSCLQGEALVHVIRPVETIEVDITPAGAALIRSVFCDITIEPVDAALWQKIAKSSAYRNKPSRASRHRVPPLAAFHLIVKSTIGTPLRLERARLLAGPASLERLSRTAAAARLRSPAYSHLDIAGLLSFRRLTTDRDSSLRIDYDRETLASTFDFIPPYDSVVTMLMFERPPSDRERIRLSLELSAAGNRRAVTCDFARRTYRTGSPELVRMRERKVVTDDE